MICKSCGTDIDTTKRDPDGTVTCPGCGTRYRPKATAQLRQAPSENEKATSAQKLAPDNEADKAQQSADEKSSGTGLKVAVSVLAVLLVIGCAIGVVLRYKEMSEGSSKHDSEQTVLSVNELIINMASQCADDFESRVAEITDYGDGDESTDLRQILDNYSEQCKRLSVAAIFTSNESLTTDYYGLYHTGFIPLTSDWILDYYIDQYNSRQDYSDYAIRLNSMLASHVSGRIDFVCPSNWTDDVHVILGTPEGNVFMWIIMTKDGETLKANYVVLEMSSSESIMQYWSIVNDVNSMGVDSELSFFSPYGGWDHIDKFENIPFSENTEITELEEPEESDDYDVTSIDWTYESFTFDDSDGYTYEITFKVSPWILLSNTDIIESAWSEVSQGNNLPMFNDWGLEKGNGSLYENYNLDGRAYARFVWSMSDMYYCMGTATIKNVTTGWSISSSNPRSVNAAFGFRNKSHFEEITNNRYDSEYIIGKVFYSNSVTNEPGGIVIKPQMLSDTWGPVTFILMGPENYSPNYPDGQFYEFFKTGLLSFMDYGGFSPDFYDESYDGNCYVGIIGQDREYIPPSQ